VVLAFGLGLRGSIHPRRSCSERRLFVRPPPPMAPIGSGRRQSLVGAQTGDKARTRDRRFCARRIECRCGERSDQNRQFGVVRGTYATNECSVVQYRWCCLDLALGGDQPSP